ncbi:MAG TPA: cupin domain-containing protein [Acidimicrobiales bacterium]|nr:cupin domain-containing protein [Acidimicrobiales bacterium]
MTPPASDAPEPQATVFRFERQPLTTRKRVDRLCRSDLLVAAVQSVGSGGETNLHAHRHLDGFWFVLSGRARFYTTGDEVVAELGPNEGVLVPRGFPYWFERVGDEVLEILQVEASDQVITSHAQVLADRIDFAEPHPDLARAREAGE